jgi:WhiB family redox-sensing transcriptional regulator
VIDSRHLPVAEHASDWRDASACREEDPNLFSPDGHSGPWLFVIAEAKSICRRCPVVDECLEWALSERIDHGVFGGLTEKERISLLRTAQRRAVSPEEAAAKIAAARTPPEPPQPRTLRGIFDAGITSVDDGHLAWTGTKQIQLDGQVHTPKQLSFTVDRGYFPDGQMRSDCGNYECVLPAHLSDMAERWQRASSTEAAV